MPFRFFSLPHLRLLKSSFMKTNPSSLSSRGNEVFTRVFPHKLKYQSLSSSNYSSRPSRNNPETRSAKSLIEDEAELSDWVSELKSDSFKKSRLYSDSDDDGGGDNDSDWRGKRKRESDSRGKGRSGGEFGVERGRGRSSGDSRGPGRFRDEMRTDLRARGRSGGELGRRNDGFRKSFEKRKEAFSDGLVPKRGGKSGSRGGFMVSDDEADLGQKRTTRKFSELISDDEDDDDDNDDDDDEEEGNIDLDDGNDGGILEKLEKPARVNPPPRSSPDGSESYLSETRFDQCAVSPLSLKAIKDAGYEKMTVVQEATLPVILKGKDVLAKARTGTGKTVAFLLPSIETVVKSPAVSRDQKRPPIMVLIICPTRELASQAAMEANKLIKYHPSIGVQVVIGGTRLGLEQKRMQASPCQILVATPGRLRDHIENTAGFATRLMGVKVLVLDEADHLLDMGFRKDIEKIIAAVPKQRQTLLFSATVPPEVRQICHVALKRDHEYINTVREGSEETHTQVQQTHLVAPLDQHFSLLYALLKDHISDDPDYKVLVFCTTAKVTQLVADLLGELKLNIREIHSRKAQTYRTRVSDEFRRSKGLILVTSDVSARGVDYPDVTLVIQVGLPADKAQYIHRLGRTGRKGKEGEGVLILAPWEQFFLSTIKDLPISKREPPLVDPDTKKKVEKAMCNVDMKNKESAYQAWLGYYNSNKTIAKDKYRLVELANEFSRSMGLDNPPAIPKLVLGKMGLKNIPGLRSK
ncbi:putative RNA helicase [Helianthus annuus]|uniref:ATP-dependent RNA helicase n=1 Tax=Helianthus annuus TaxID=4232 RepID=A0A251S1Q4_HELAN|nr:DEAD-box ATP-dependent RNA helicase 31 [Helianthus annuus]KAF5761542.1 putative RNA helicase [Helianthus annuus]KAJ0439382.1 putative RNA helicase [Helianthus annuus]KAJ0461735.1 putative RNA helicase [Helianthus annuus]KAJ0642135.1 putative RNA helicase [Helianthus annuus]KAJ0646019.1 putative RNA helicase [Helianthus annuus]